MKILVTGAGGMLGTDLTARLAAKHQVAGCGITPAPHLKIPYEVFDLTDRAKTAAWGDAHKPDVIFHTAAATDVDRCETDDEYNRRGNLTATESITEAARKTGARLVFFSTDYIFDGSKAGEYKEEDAPKPVNRYGEMKLKAEAAVRKYPRSTICRITWLYGVHGKSFPRTIWERARSQDSFNVVDDQKGRPTYTKDVASALAGILDRPELFKKLEDSTIHLGNAGAANWAEFARFVLKSAGFSGHAVKPITSRELARPARRPENSVLSLEKAESLGITLRPWQEAVSDFLRELQNEKPL